MDPLFDDEMTGTIRTARHPVVRYRAGHESGDLFEEGQDYDGLTLTIEVSGKADVQAMLDAISAKKEEPMTEAREILKDHIKAVLEGIRHLDVDAAADLIAEVGDEIAGDRDEDMFNGAILDGIRWGYAAAVTVEMGGGAMVRTILPGGIAMTHEWASENDALPQIDAALDAIASARDGRVSRIVAEGAGE